MFEFRPGEHAYALDDMRTNVTAWIARRDAETPPIGVSKAPLVSVWVVACYPRPASHFQRAVRTTGDRWAIPLEQVTDPVMPDDALVEAAQDSRHIRSLIQADGRLRLVEILMQARWSDTDGASVVFSIAPAPDRESVVF